MILSLRNGTIDMIFVFITGAVIAFVVALVIGYSWARSNAETARFEYCQKVLTETRVTKVTAWRL